MITVEHLTKCYDSFKAVDDLSFEIDEGHVYGFLGPNGAGKSTTMNVMTGCLSATDGRVLIDGHDIFEEPEAAKRLIGYLPEQPPLYMNETPLEYLRFVGQAKGIRGRELQSQVAEVVEQVKIDNVKNRLIGNLSKGYKQRVGIAQALLGNPKVIILDEPTVGLDPIQIIEIRDLIKQLGQTHTVILSSHILSEIQAVCDQVLIIAHGKLVAFDAPENLEKLMLGSNAIEFTVEAESSEVGEVLDDIDSITNWESKDGGDGMTKVSIQTGADNSRDICRHIFFAFAERRRAIIEMSYKKANLEDVFLELTDSAGAEPPAEISGAETAAAEPATLSGSVQEQTDTASENIGGEMHDSSDEA